MLSRGLLVEVAVDWDASIQRACFLSGKHTAATGARGFDLLHVALALDLESEVFFTTDDRQGRIATAEGLKVASVRAAD